MRRLLTALTLAAALAPTLAACGGDDQPSASPTDVSSSSSSSTPSSSASAASCDTFLSQDDAEKAAGTSLDPGQSAAQGDVQACQWKGKTAGVQALKAPADQWALQLPAVLRTYRSTGTKIPGKVQADLDQAIKDVQRKKEISADQACGLFAELSTIPDPGTGGGVITTVLPSEQNPQAVSAQACTDGTYLSVTVAAQGLSKSAVKDTITRTDDALATLEG